MQRLITDQELVAVRMRNQNSFLALDALMPMIIMQDTKISVIGNKGKNPHLYGQEWNDN